MSERVFHQLLSEHIRDSTPPKPLRRHINPLLVIAGLSVAFGVIASL